MKQPKTKAAAREFYGNVIALGRMAHARMLQEMRSGERLPSFTEIRELEENIKICERELEKLR